MKSLSLIFALLLACSGGIYAQGSSAKVRHSIAQDVPMEVLATIESGYPGLNIHQHLVVPEPVVKKVKRIDKIRSEPLRPYFAIYKGRDYRKREVYTKGGELIYSRERVGNVALPHAVYNYIGREYNGWLIKKNVAIKIVDKSATNPRNVKYFKVLLQDGKKKKRLLLDEQGNIYSRRRS